MYFVETNMSITVKNLNVKDEKFKLSEQMPRLLKFPKEHAQAVNSRGKSLVIKTYYSPQNVLSEYQHKKQGKH